MMMMTIPKMARRVRAEINLTEGDRDLVVAQEIVKTAAVEDIDDRPDRDLALQGQLVVVRGLARRREVGRGVPLAQGVGQGIAHDHHAGKGGSHEDPVQGAGPNPVPVPETVTETETGIETKGEGAAEDRGVDHMIGHVTAGRGLVQGRHMREGGATVLAHDHVIVTVIGEQPTPLRTCVCVSACHITAQMLPIGSLEW